MEFAIVKITLVISAKFKYFFFVCDIYMVAAGCFHENMTGIHGF